MALRLIIFSSDGRAARNVSLGPLRLAMASLASLAVIGVVLWLGWKIGEFTAQF